MPWGKKKSGGGGGVAWLALIVALVALFLAWKAYERTGGDLDGILRLPLGEIGGMEVGERERERGAEGVEGTVERQADLAQARARLLARRTEVAARSNLQQVQEEVAEVRDQVQSAYQGAGDQARQGWRELDADLERLQAQLRDGSSRAVETLDSAVDKMRRIGEDG